MKKSRVCYMLLLVIWAVGATAETGDVSLVGPEGNLFWDTVPSVVSSQAQRGDVLWAKERLDAPAGVAGWNIIYVTEGVQGNLEYVSGEIYYPKQVADSPRPIIVWNSGTVGFQDSCAPSRNPLNYSHEWDGMRVPALEDFIARGKIVVMSDYQGLGTPGGFPFANGRAQGMAALDAARAARAFLQDNADNKVGLYGFSLGGQTVLWAAHLAESYAPELNIIGAAMIAPASSHLELAHIDLETPENAGYFIARAAGLQIGHPGLRLRDILTETGLELLTAQAWGCADVFIEAEAAQEPVGKASALGAEQPWGKRFKSNDQFLPIANTIPLLLAQGDKDVAVPVEVTRKLRENICSQGGQLQYIESAGHDHFTIVQPVASLLPDWFDARLHREAVKSNCITD